MDTETTKVVIRVILAVASYAAKKGLDMVSAPPLFGFILLALAAALVWSVLVHSGWFSFLTRKYIHYTVYVIIVLIFMPLVLFVRPQGTNAPTDIDGPVISPPSAEATARNSPAASVIAIGQANSVTVNQSAHRESIQPPEEEKVFIELQGGQACDDCPTQFAQIPSFPGPKKTVITTRWPIIISNNSESTVSFTHYEAVSRIRGEKRSIQTRLLNREGSPTSLPINLKGGESMKLLLVVPIHIIDSVYDIVRDIPEFSNSFVPDALDDYLEKNHGMDFYGNSLKYAEKAGGNGPNRLAAHLFHYDEDGTLARTAMQADQVTVEFKTARGAYFSAKALYFDDGVPFGSQPTMTLPRGEPATIRFRPEPFDSLPTKE